MSDAKIYYADRIVDDGGATELDCAQVVLKSDYDKLTAKHDRLREALEAVRDMPEYDQDDQYRLREISRAALQEARDE